MRKPHFTEEFAILLLALERRPWQAPLVEQAAELDGWAFHEEMGESNKGACR